MSADSPGHDSLPLRYRSVRYASETLTAPLSAEDQAVQSMPDASPTKWHLAHTSWFFETFLLVPHQPDYRCFDERYGYLFNSYYEAVGPRHARPRRGLLTRPGLDEVWAYRRHVDRAMERLLGESAESLRPLVELGLHHEQQHQELILTDILHAFSLNPLLPAAFASRPEPEPNASPQEWTLHPGGVVEIGHGGVGVCFDNELPRHKVLLRPYRLAARLVSNGEYGAFIADDGYRRPDLWLADGWATVQAEGWTAPLYWLADGRQMTLTGPQALDDDAPVRHVGYYEADAFARWAGKRLPNEAEWEAGAPQPHMFGQVWQWTASPYTAYPGFRPAAGAVGEYNGKFMCNQMVLRGGSSATPPGHARSSYRNFFYPAQRWQFAGFRLAEDA